MSACIYRKLKGLEKKVKGGEEKEDMIVATEIDIETNTEGFVTHMPESYSIYVLHIFGVFFTILSQSLVLNMDTNSDLDVLFCSITVMTWTIIM